MEDAVKDTVKAMTDGRTIENRYGKIIAAAVASAAITSFATSYIINKRAEKKRTEIVEVVK